MENNITDVKRSKVLHEGARELAQRMVAVTKVEHARRKEGRILPAGQRYELGYGTSRRAAAHPAPAAARRRVCRPAVGVPLKADAPAGRVEIDDRRQGFRKRARPSRVVGTGGCHTQCLMGTLLVVFLPPAVKLLLPTVQGSQRFMTTSQLVYSLALSGARHAGKRPKNPRTLRAKRCPPSDGLPNINGQAPAITEILCSRQYLTASSETLVPSA